MDLGRKLWRRRPYPILTFDRFGFFGRSGGKIHGWHWARALPSWFHGLTKCWVFVGHVFVCLLTNCGFNNENQLNNLVVVYSNPPCSLIHPSSCWKPLEMHPLCYWLVLFQVSPQRIPQAHPIFQTRVLLKPWFLCLWQPQTPLADNQHF